MSSRRRTILVLVLLCPLAGGCGEGVDAKQDWGAKPVTVEVATVRPQLLSDVVAFSGQFASENSVLLESEISGVVESIQFEEGHPVEQGQVLFQLRDAEQRAKLQEAEAEQRLARDVHERTQQLASQAISSLAARAEALAKLDETAARVELAKLALERTRIRAPFDGVAGVRLVAPGDRVTPGDGLVSVDAIDRLQLLFTIQEMGVTLAREGVQLNARVAAFPGETFAGEVFFVSPTVDPATRRLLLKAWVRNDDHRLKPGMFANVDVEISRKSDALVVAESAVVYDRHGTYVWRVIDEKQAEKIPVEIGIRKDGRVELTAGVESGDMIVTAGTHKVKAGSQLRWHEDAPAEQAREPAGQPGRKGAEG